MAAPAEHSETEFLLATALELVLRLVALMERIDPAALDEFIELLGSVSRETERED